jgi:hypothetical protein
VAMGAQTATMLSTWPRQLGRHPGRLDRIDGSVPTMLSAMVFPVEPRRD